ncbi:hypothetical protein GCM10011351_00430 [Paraliobacillus quinghaiensis]|uniref:DUF4352 domain-containing protein n=1 Tax=Paraliobacillus quinghaiensis TaxID=470815 RepID=A0A917TDR1_9BACI|nr:DUF4352 domain-containing protein [Paraliobacillus quinghaiensis]GGM18568.1 hypothetical protein GCM10011351_00430 [Paraliobacillus quinghaiensis]
MKKLYYLILAVVFVLVLTACGEAEVGKVDDSNNEAEENAESAEADSDAETENDTESDTENTGEEADAEESQEESEPVEDQVYGIGDTVAIDGMEVTIDSASWVEANEYIEAENGNVLRLEVSFHNESAESGFVDNTEFDVYDANGSTVSEYYGSDDADTNMFTFDLKKGKNGSGALEFDTADSEYFEVYYEPTFTFKENAEIQWVINSSDIQ